MSADFDRLYLESKQGDAVIMGNGKICGHVIGKKYIKQIHSQHLMTVPPAIAIDKAVFVRSIQPYCDRIFILNMDNGEFFSTSVDNFLKHSFYMDRKFGSQLALGMEHWSKNKGVVHQVALPI
jgi:hypothetical protein